MNIASFDVDAQKGFTELCPAELPVKGGQDIVPALNAMARRASLRVASKDSHAPNAVWVVDSHEQMLRPLDLPDADLTWVAHCVPGTPGFESLDGLPRPMEYDFMVYKGVEPDAHPYGACYHDLASRRSTGVIEFLRGRKVSAVIVGGLALDYCVRTTALQLAAAGFQVALYTPACRAISAQGAEAALIEMAAAGIACCDDLHSLDTALARFQELYP